MPTVCQILFLHFTYTSNNSDRKSAVDNFIDKEAINITMRNMRKMQNEIATWDGKGRMENSKGSQQIKYLE